MKETLAQRGAWIVRRVCPMYLSLWKTKAIVMDAFKDVHTGLGTLGQHLHIRMNPNVTLIQADPHRCPGAKEADAIRNLEKQSILKKVTELTAWIFNSVYREKPDGSICVCIDPSQTINKPIEVSTAPEMIPTPK